MPARVIPLNNSRSDDFDDREVDVAPRSSAREEKKQRKEAYIRERESLNIEDLFKDLGIRSFKEEYRRLTKLAGDEDFSSSKTTAATRRALLAMMINFLPQLEENCHRFPNERSAYALSACVSSIRELIHDLESRGDASEMNERMRREVLQPTLSSLATTLVAQATKTRQSLHAALPPREAKLVDRALRKQQAQLAESFAQAEASAAERIAAVTTPK